jgi:hypothetical protein
METVSTINQIFITPDGSYIKIRMVCSNCGKTKWSKKIPSDKPCKNTNIKCKCGVDGYDWTYEPPKVGDNYVRINSSASVSMANMPKLVIRNEKNFQVSNGNKK